MYLNVCKSCGGELIREGNYLKCKFCGNVWTVDADSDVHVIDRANAWAALRDCDFEKAGELFENIILKEPDNHESYWGRALALSGIIYVTDLNESKRVPTCNSISEDSFVDSPDVKKAIKLSPSEIADSYRAQAAQIERIRIEWLEKASKEPPYDVFICFKDSDRERGLERTDDSYEAQNLYHALEKEGYKVFFSRESLRDKVSEQYEPYIYNALKTAKVMIVFGERAEYFNAVWVKNEWTRFRARIESGEKHEKAMVVVYKNMSPADLPVGLRSRQCMNAGEITFLQDLIRHIDHVVGAANSAAHLERVDIKGGKVSKKASRIANAGVETRELGAGASVQTDVSEKQRLDLVQSYVKSNMWEDAAALVGDILFNNPNCSEAIWYSLLINHRLFGKDELIKKVGSFTDTDFALLEKVLNNGSREFASDILDSLYLSRTFLREDAYERVLKMILPFNYENRSARISESFNYSIEKGYLGVFRMLITTLASDDVDKYIQYYVQFARSTPDVEEKLICAKEILKVEEGNPDALRITFEALWGRGSTGELVSSFEELLRYSKDPQTEVLWALGKAKRALVSREQCGFVTQALRYFSGNLADIKDLLIDIAYVMISDGFFDSAKYILELTVAAGCDEPRVYWGICLVKVSARGDADIKKSDVLIKTVPEYTKYLTLVDESRRMECFALAADQEKASKKRASDARAREARAAQEEQERKNRINAEKARLAKIRRKKVGKVLTGISVILGLFLVIFVVYPMLSYTGGNYAPYINMYGVTDFTVPDGVTEIKEEAFSGCYNLESLTIPDGVHSIGAEAIAYCEKLTNITVADSIDVVDETAFEGTNNIKTATVPMVVIGCLNTQNAETVVITSGTYLYDNAFYGSTFLQSVTLPDELAVVGEFAFENCNSLKDIVIPDNVNKIGSCAFYNCSALESITLGNKLSEIGSDAFYGCSALKKVNIDDIGAWSNVSFGSEAANPLAVVGELTVNGSTVTELIIPEGTKTIGNWDYANMKNLTKVVIPDSVTSVGYYAFSGCENLKTVVLGSGVTSIGDCAFANCVSLESIELGKNITELGYDVFVNCKGIKNVTTPAVFLSYIPLASVENITIFGNADDASGGYVNNNCFKNSSVIKSVTLDENITYIGYDAFYGCTSLESVKFLGCSPEVLDSAFAGCESLKSVYINSVEDWSRIKFEDTYSSPFCYASRLYVDGVEVTEISVPSDVTEIGQYAFAGLVNVTKINIHEGVTSIGHGAFALTSISEIVIPAGVTYIGNDAFNNCASLEKLTVLAENISIGQYAFANCGALKELTFRGGEVSFGNKVFEGTNAIERATVSVNTLPYFTKGCLKEVSVISGDVPNGAFRDCVTLEKVTLGEGIVNVNYEAFRGCTALESVVIPDSVENIGDNCFYGCTSLESVTVGKGVVNLGRGSFNECNSINKVEIKDIAAWCNVVIWDSNASPIRNGAALYFDGALVTELVIPEGTETVKARVFADCSGIVSVTIPESVTSVGDYAFGNCQELKSIDVRAIIDSGSFSSNAFSDCSSLESASIPANLAYRMPKTLKKITVASGEDIPGDGFRDFAALESVIIGDSVTSISYRAFYNCTALKSIVIPDSVTVIGENAFADCTALESVTMGKGITSIERYAFDDCESLKDVYIVDLSAWCGVSLGDIESNPMFVATGNLYVGGEKTVELVIPEDVTSISARAFVGMPGVKKLVLHNGVTSIGDNAFAHSLALSEVSVGVGSKLANIGYCAFYCCYDLTSFTVTPNVVSIGNNAFEYCYKLIEICNLSELNIQYASSAYGYVGYYAENIYKTGSGESRIVKDDDFIFYCDEDQGRRYLMAYAGDLTELVLPDSVNNSSYEIYRNAFSSNTALTKVTISDGVTVIGEDAFVNCSALSAVEFGGGLQKISGGAFSGCSSLTEVNISEGTVEIGYEAFRYCTALTKVTIPASVTSIGNYSFNDCRAVEEISVPTRAVRYFHNDSLKRVELIAGEQVDAAMFRGYTALESVALNGTITAICDDAFDGCEALKEIFIPKTVVSIGSRAFRGCNSLETVYYEGDEAEWSSISFGFENTPLTNATKEYQGAK